jgi:XTP/dITP diphosphohydrolase
MRLSNKVVLASLNRHKLFEFRSLLSGFAEIELIPFSELARNADSLHHVEQFNTYLENAAAKARTANQATHYPALADDSGLEVDALNGKPGVRSHRYAPPKAKVTQDQANMDLLLSEMKSAQSRSARFVCSVALNIEGVLLSGTGVLEGTIITTPRGTHGFGYDPVFVPQGSDKTLAEIPEAEKNRISHRKKAIDDLMKKVQAHGIVFAKP